MLRGYICIETKKSFYNANIECRINITNNKIYILRKYYSIEYYVQDTITNQENINKKQISNKNL